MVHTVRVQVPFPAPRKKHLQKQVLFSVTTILRGETIPDGVIHYRDEVRLDGDVGISSCLRDFIEIGNDLWYNQYGFDKNTKCQRL